MKARSITRRKELRDDGSIVEIAIWQLPEPLPPCSQISGGKWRTGNESDH
jgi:hypothetical protein